jgi:CHAT domain-containing protein
MVPASTVLLGSDASEQRLDALAQAGKLKSFRLVHLATHASVDWRQPERSRLLLARDRLPDPLEQVRQNKTVYTGDLTVQAIRHRWRLDADLVVLSACATGLGHDAGGDGLLGFAQAFLSRGARSVVLSRWQVDDEATALLMVRFYRNLLGKRAGLKKPLGKAEALAEAQHWLRNLRLHEVRDAVASLPRGRVAARKAALRGVKPYAHPHYWAGFLLIGDPGELTEPGEVAHAPPPQDAPAPRRWLWALAGVPALLGLALAVRRLRHKCWATAPGRSAPIPGRD